MAYPPPDHYLSDLKARPVFDVDESRVVLEVTPLLCGPGGGVLLGILATAIDMAAGGMSRRHADPDWVATSDIAIDLAAPVPPGPCQIACRLARRGRSLVTLELDLSTGRGEAPARCGVATAAFAVLPNPGHEQGSGERGDGREARSEGDASPSSAAGNAGATSSPSSVPASHRPSARASLPLHQRLGIQVLDAGRGVIEAPLDDYVRNTFGALQGGVAAVLGEAAILASTARPLAALGVRYRSLGRIGPFRTEVDLLPGTMGAVARAILRDLGSGGAVVAVATGRLAPV